ncbi:MAG: hypothetical protein AAFQ42_10105 [Pseudomonadota bacterium]
MNEEVTQQDAKQGGRPGSMIFVLGFGTAAAATLLIAVFIAFA